MALSNKARAARTCHRSPHRFGAGNQADAVRLSVQVGHHGFHLGRHAACAELPAVQQRLGLVDGEFVKPALLRRAKMDGNLFHAGWDQQHVGFEFDSQQGRCAVFIDNRLGLPSGSVLLTYDGNTAAAAGDHQRVISEQALNDRRFDNFYRLR